LTVRDKGSTRDVDSGNTLIPYLVVLSGDERGRRFPLDRQINVIGRGTESDITVNDAKISRTHAALLVFPDRIVLEDRRSTNGTYVDGKRIESVTVTVQSRIRAGNCLLKIDYKDPTELEFEQALYDAATTDALTGISNRTAFMDNARQQVSFCRRNDMHLTLGMCDADHFKQVNDRLGHPAGDFVLQELSRIVQREIRQEDLLGRYGGEEFILLLPRIGPQAARECFERVRVAVADHEFRTEETRIPVTVSIGACTLKGQGIHELAELIDAADRALYRAKQGGRNRVEIG